MAKKTLFGKLILGFTPVAFLLLPLVVQASMLSFLTTLFERGANTTNAGGLNLNSQTMPLLEPATNLNPNPARGGGNITLADGVALVPVESPTGEAVDMEEHPHSAQISVYTVREGDTLTQIAEMFDVTVNTIIWANDIKGRSIQPGQELVILPVTGIRHTVAKGDTLESVAKKYKGDAAEIALYNELEDGALAVGSTVIIPSGVLSTPTTPARPKSSGSMGNVALQSGGGPAYEGYYVWPVNGGVKTQGIHGYNGIDIGAKAGTEIYAAAAGIVLVARNNGGWNGGYGNYVVIQHNNGTQTLYAHATTVLVAPGDSVGQGQTIATVGRTGQSTGNHLHFEVRGAKNPF